MKLIRSLAESIMNLIRNLTKKLMVILAESIMNNEKLTREIAGQSVRSFKPITCNILVSILKNMMIFQLKSVAIMFPKECQMYVIIIFRLLCIIKLLCLLKQSFFVDLFSYSLISRLALIRLTFS